MHTDTRLIVYNDEIFIPYHSGGFAEADEVPFDFAVMKMKTDGQDLVKMKEPSADCTAICLFGMTGFSIRITGMGPRAIDPDDFKDSTLVLYSTAMDGRSDKRKEFTFDARVTYDLLR